MEDILTAEENLTEQSENIRIKSKKKRIWELDFIRGICVLLMIFDHIMFDLGLFGYEWGNWNLVYLKEFYWSHNVRIAIRFTVISLFFFISGISSTFSRSNLYRALKVLIFAYGVTLFTSFVGIDIRFGVLHVFGYSMLIYALLNLIDKTMWSKLVLGSVFLVFGILIECNRADFLRLPDSMQWLNNALGMAPRDYSIDDYFGLLPWTGVFLLGSVIGKLFYKERKSLLGKIETKFTKPVEFLGKHTLIIYPLHQLIIFGIFCLISVAKNLPLPF